MNKLPSGWLARATAAGRVAARIGRAAAVRAVRRTDEADDRALGDALTAELDRLKGLSMCLWPPRPSARCTGRASAAGM